MKHTSFGSDEDYWKGSRDVKGDMWGWVSSVSPPGGLISAGPRQQLPVCPSVTLLHHNTVHDTVPGASLCNMTDVFYNIGNECPISLLRHLVLPQQSYSRTAVRLG
ncbi:hypothetical protein J6590_072047 [Homalodisca vitripennis]|nr:hypothetical protein J6590_072047 [Homalodisca vitripennis]